DGSPYGSYGANHIEFQSDAYRTIMNMAVDFAWYNNSTDEQIISEKLQKFL
ncbi:MAG: xylanase, partial [Flavobacterium sp.]|nr:xylanase [Flavobacterium sp.]